MDFETLAARNSRLIFASITGFGRTGPYGDWPGVDQIAQGMSGLMSLTGQPESGPTRVGIPIGDVVAGMWAALGIQSAVKRRLNACFAKEGKMHWTGELVKLGLPAGPILTLDQVFNDPHVLATRMIEEFEHPLIGTMRTMANPIRMDALTGNSVRRAPPALGQDSRAVLADYALSNEQIDALVAARVVQTNG